MSQSSLDIIYSNLISYQVLNNCNIGIGNNNPLFKLDVNGDINFTSNLKLNGCNLPFSIYTGTNVIASNAYFSYINNCNNYAYYQYLIDGSISFPQTTSCDVICVGAGGNGGLGFFSGGGGAGEVIVYPNFNFNSNINYKIQVGLSSINSNIRISRISSNNTDVIRASGGGDGGSIIINTTYNSNNIFIPKTGILTYNNENPISINSGTYNITFNLSPGNINITGLNANNSYPVLRDTTTGSIIQPYIWYKFDGNATQMLIDSGTANNNLTNINSSLFDTTNYVKGYGSVNFIATNQQLILTNDIPLYTMQTTTGISISLWVKVGSTINYAEFFRFDKNPSSFYIRRRESNTNTLDFGMWGDAGDTYLITIVSIITFSNTWTHIVWTITQSGFWTIYINGINQNITSTRTLNSRMNTQDNKAIGSGSGTTTAVGNRDDFRIYSKVLTQAEIQELYNGRVTIYTNPETGGSSGGTYINTSNISFGISFNPGYSNMTAGSSGNSNIGGNGGSATLTGGLIENITSTNLILGIGGSGATSNSVPNILNETTYGSGGDGNGGFGTQGTVIIRVPLNIQKPIFNGYIDYNNIDNKPYINTILNSKELIDVGYFNQINFPMANVAWANEWFLYMGMSPSLQSNSFIFWHNNSNSSINSKWWFNGTIANTNNEISDSRVKKEINGIQDPISKLMTLKPKEYYLCDDKDYLKKYGIIAQDVKEVIPELVYTDTDYIANIYSKCNYSYEIENNRNLLILPLSSEITITSNINVNDELKLLLDNNNGNNQEIIIEDLPYHNRYKKRFVKVKEIIDERTIEIYEKLELTEIEKENLFIYGKKTKDFLKLDYSSIYTLNVATTQELVKLIEEQKNEINELKSRLILLENKININ